MNSYRMEGSIKCFLIDDDTDDQEIFGQALDSIEKPVECSFANDGVQALEKLNDDKSFIPDFIFIDMNMPRMNGIQCLEAIKKIDRLKEVILYMYSTAADPRTIAETQRLGAVEFIVKPSNFKELTQKLSQIFNHENSFHAAGGRNNV